jgi:hypothetical protein
MPRGGHKVKPAKATQTDTSAPSSIVTKLTRRNTDWKSGVSKPSFLTRNSSETKLAGAGYQPSHPAQELSLRRAMTTDVSIKQPGVSVNSNAIMNTTVGCAVTVDFIHKRTTSECNGERVTVPRSPLDNLESSLPPIASSTPSIQLPEEKDSNEAALDTFEDLTMEETRSSASSSYSRDNLSLYSSDSASIYSSASSIYSSGASMYSFDEEAEMGTNSHVPGRSQYQQRTRTTTIKRTELQDAASRERSTLAKKAALFKNSRLPPELPPFNTSLPAWSMICRAAQASCECYDSESSTRRGTYTPADTSKDIKAMIVDDQLVDHSRLVIVAIRGTQFQCLADWSVNKAANPVKPVGFLDNEENACHAGFLQVTKAMTSQVAAQLDQLPESSERPSLLFTGHSAGGAVAAMLYSHMLSQSVESVLTKLASQFPSINCVTFGAPPLSLTPLPNQPHGNGVFLAFANEGDPVLRLSNAAYVKSLVKLMTASPPSSVASAPPVKIVRGSRGTRVIRQAVPTAPLTPWAELPLWPTPPAPLTNAGDVILLRDNEVGSAVASRVMVEEMKDVIFGDLAQHTTGMYMRRVKEVAFAAMMGRGGN